MTSYSVVVISYRRPDLVARVMARLEEQIILPRTVYVVDNGGDLDAAVVSERRFATTLIRRPDNPGYAGAVNAVRESFSVTDIQRLLVLTHDAVFAPTLASSLLKALSAPEVGAAAPVINLASSPRHLFSAGGVLTANGRAYHRTVLPAPDIGASATATVDWVDGAVVMYARAALESIEWLDERYFLYFEDVDTAWRMARTGYRTVVSLEEQAYQDPGTHPPYLGIRNMTLFARSADIPYWRTALAVARRIVEESIVAILRGHLPPLAACIRGWRDGINGVRGKDGV